MTEAMVGLLLEAALKSAIESGAALRKMRAEGRTKANEQEIKAIQDATDIMMELARQKGELL